MGTKESKIDIDIDTPSSFNPLDIFPNWIKASQIQSGEYKPHPCGVYSQNIPKEYISGLAAIPYKEAEELGFYKLDFLHNNVYDMFTSKEEIDALIEIEPNWDILLMPSEQVKLFQLSKHGDVLNQVRPKSIEDLADTIALIRPGKRVFLDLYLKNKQEARKILYAKTDGYYFKKSHAHAYALVIVLQLHLISEGIM